MITIDGERLLARFLRYVQMDTTACPESTTYPSSAGQLALGRVVVDELHAMGLTDATQDEHGIVLATIPASTAPGTATGQNAPTIAFCAHFDTSPETSGKNVRPQVWRKYDGRDLTLPGDPRQVLRVKDNPELQSLIGKTIVTSDGTTLLGSDDKSGLAVIMEAAAWLVEHPEVAHGPVRLCFTCDEEIGHGVDHVSVEQVGAVVCYTLDGSGTNDVDVETFSADLATITIQGINIHPSIAKGRMVNAVRAAAALVDRLPRDRLSPETTADREGFLHPYTIEGGVERVTLRVLLRDFDTTRLKEQATLLRDAAAAVTQEFPGVTIDMNVAPQYRNMADGLAREPRAVAFAEKAIQRLGRTPQRTIIRGGTDGSRLTEIGLPTPNLSTGEHNPHSPLEWTCLEEMVQAAEVVVAICQEWSRGE